MATGSARKYVIDSREAFVPGYDLDGNFMPDEEREQLRLALFASDADEDDDIRAFINDWLTEYAKRKHRPAASA